MDKEELIKNFVGVKYEKLYNKNFSIFALLFGWCYFIYRKMLLAGFGFLILQTAISSFFNTLDKSTVIISYLLINLSLSLLFNSMYRNHVQKKVSIIMATSQNEEDVMKKCIKKGGTSVSWVIVSIIITIILMLIFTLIYGAIFVVDSAIDLVIAAEEDLKNSTMEDLKKRTIIFYKGGSFFDFKGIRNLSDYITYEIDEKFELDDVFKDMHVYKDGDKLLSEVKFFIAGYENIIITDEFKNQIKEEKKNLNGKEWIIYKIIEDTEANQENKEEYYSEIFAITKIKDLNIVMNYKIGEDVENKESAIEEFNNIMESIQYK